MVPAAAVAETHSLQNIPYSVLPTGSSERAERRLLLKIVDALNSMNIGLKFYLPHAAFGKIGMIKYSSAEGLRATLQELALPDQVTGRIMQ